MSKWITHILWPKQESEIADHIPLEDIASMIDGTLNKDKRSEYIIHLNQCKSCFNVLTSTLKSCQEYAPESRLGKNRFIYLIAASIIFLSIITGTVVFNNYKGSQTISLAMDQQFKTILMENTNLNWTDPLKIERLKSLLQQRGIHVKQFKQVHLSSLYYPTKSLFENKEILKIKIKKGVAYIEVVEEE